MRAKHSILALDALVCVGLFSPDFFNVAWFTYVIYGSLFFSAVVSWLFMCDMIDYPDFVKTTRVRAILNKKLI
jgi:hypothetical protein